MHEPVHFHYSSLDKKTNIFLLLVPSLVFFLVLAILFFNISRNGIQIATDFEQTVLGKSEKLK